MGATPLHRLSKVYGENVIVSRVNGYNIVHCDNPTDTQIRERIQEVLNGRIDDDFHDDCPLCKTFKGKKYDIVYYKQS